MPANQKRSAGVGCSRAAWVEQQKGRKATLYVVRLAGGGEVFYKVGITFCMGSRFNRLNLPYGLRTLARYSSYDAGRVWDLEQQMHRLLASHSYSPMTPFAGHTECFNEAAAILALLPADSFILKHTKYTSNV